MPSVVRLSAECRLVAVLNDVRTADLGFSKQPDLADRQHVVDAGLTILGGPVRLDQTPSTVTRVPLVMPSSATSAYWFPHGSWAAAGKEAEVMADTAERVIATARRILDALPLWQCHIVAP